MVTCMICAQRQDGIRVAPSHGYWRVLAGLGLAWLTSTVVAYVAFPRGDGPELDHVAAVLRAGWWSSPLLSWPLFGIFLLIQRSRLPWWRQSRWAFGGLLTSILIACALIVGIAHGAAIAFGQDGGVVTAVEPMVGAILWCAWTLLPLWSLFWGIMLGGVWSHSRCN